MPGSSHVYRPLPAEDMRHILEHTASLWEEARGEAFFITGGTGFFGVWILESLAFINDALGLGITAVILSRDPEGFAKKAPHLTNRQDFQFIRGDIRSFQFPAGRFRYVIHAATEASVKLNQENPGEMLDAIVAGMQHVLDFATRAGSKKMLFTSSGAVYGLQPSSLTHIPEDYQGAPDPMISTSAYGEGKRIAELMATIHAANSDCEVKIARCFAFVGPHLPLNSHFAVGNFLRDAMNGESIKIGGDGTPHRSYLYAADLAVWLWSILFKAPSARAFNVGSEESRDIAEIAGFINQFFASKSPIEIAQKPITGQEISRYVPSTRRADSELGLKAWVNFAEAIRKTVAWHTPIEFSLHDR